MTNRKKIFTPIIIVFIIINTIVITGKAFLSNKGFDIDFLIYANLLLFAISLGGAFIQKRGLQSSNTNVFVRGVYASMMLKMFVCMFAVLIYVFMYKTKINKPSLFTSMGLYIVYTVIEVSSLSKFARKKTDA
jgi:Ca2+/Na+ antiporter